MRGLLGKYRGVVICLFLAGGVLAVYWQLLESDFINLDDTIYVTDNKHVRTGLNMDNVKWAFSVGKVA